MKLTNTHIATLQAALRLYEEKTEGRILGHPDGTFWKEENATAKELQNLLEHALSIQVESIQLDDHACGDIHCDGKHCAPTNPAAAITAPMAGEPSRPTVVSSSHAIPSPAAAALFSHRLADSPHHLDSQAADKELPHTAAAPAPTVLPLQVDASRPKDHATTLDTKRQQLAQLLDQAGYQTEEKSSPIPDSGSAPSISSTLPSQPKSSSDSSADPSQPAAIPQLIRAIDACGSVAHARRKVYHASPEALSAAAQFLGVDVASVSSAITRRVRARLLASL